MYLHVFKCVPSSFTTVAMSGCCSLALFTITMKPLFLLLLASTFTHLHKRCSINTHLQHFSILFIQHYIIMPFSAITFSNLGVRCSNNYGLLGQTPLKNATSYKGKMILQIFKWTQVWVFDIDTLNKEKAQTCIVGAQ